MKRKVGQSIIAVVFLFAMTITMVLVFFTLSIGGGERGNSQFLKEVEPQIQYKIGEVKKRSVVTTTMDDFLWRSNDIERGKYDDKVARKILSYYVSTPPMTEDEFSEDSIYVDGEDYTTEEVKSDLESYFRHKMEKHWAEGAGSVSYLLEVDGGEQEDIVVQTEGYEPQPGHSGHGYTVATVNEMTPRESSDTRDSVRVVLWTSGSNSLWGIEQ